MIRTLITDDHELFRKGLGRVLADVNAIDGVRVSSPDGWWLLRASNTQDALVARAEADSEEGLERLKAELAGQLRASGLEPPPSL